jgi:hypothetical protein
MPISFGRVGSVSIATGGVDVHEELEATVAVRRLPHGDVRVVSVEANRGIGPLSADRVAAENGHPGAAPWW